MDRLPTRANADGCPVTIASFFEAGRERLGLKLVAGGENMDRLVKEPVVNRPGLALTGFYECFACNRVQIIGKAETAYLKSLDDATRLARLKALIDRDAFCFVYTNGLGPRPDERRLAESAGAVMFVSPLQTRAFAGQCSFVLERLAAPLTTIYGTTVEVAGLGVLFEGDPGMGKSETALGLIKRGCALVADDLTCIRKEVSNNTLFASASEATAGFMEIRGIGIMHIPSIFGVNAVRSEKQLQLVITLKRLKDVQGEIDRIGQTRRVRSILGVDVPNVVIPVSEGRDLVNLVEAAAQQQKLLLLGCDPVDALSDRLHARASKFGAGAGVLKKKSKTRGK